MIEIKSYYTDWHEVNEEVARRYVRWLMKNLPMVRKADKKPWIEKNRLRGITIDELRI